MKLFLVHCGYYDTSVCNGVFEQHVNFMVAAESFDDARARAKLLPDFKAKRMHVDGLQEIAAVNGCRVELTEDASLDGKTIMVGSRHRDLAPKSAGTALA